MDNDFLYNLDWKTVITKDTGVALTHFNEKGQQPCPNCGGKDRFHFTNLHGNGTFICRICGSSDGIGLISLIENKLDSVTQITKQMRKEVFIRMKNKYGSNKFKKITNDRPKIQTLSPIIPSTKELNYKTGTNIELYNKDGSETKIHNYSKFWQWLDYDGSLIGYIGRKKCKTTHQIYLTSKGWTQGSLTKPRPLFGLNNLQNNSPVIIVEGENTWDSVNKNTSRYSVITWVGGANAVKQSDWSILQDREIYIFPDNDTPGICAAENIQNILQQNNSVKIIYPPQEKPEKWDLADEENIDDDMIDSLILSTNKDSCYNIENTKLIYANGRTVGEVIFEELYSKDKYICFEDTLRKYEDGYYKKIDDNLEKFKITKFLRNVVTNSNTGSRGFTKSLAVDEALKYIKLNFHIDIQKTNPTGINLANGYLKLSYSKNNEPIFKLLPHSPKYYFTYKSNVNYLPSNNSDCASNALDEILDPKATTALLRTLAASLDLEKVRELCRRDSIRALILKGTGVNGKDTIRLWSNYIFGTDSFSDVDLQTLYRADHERLFRLDMLSGKKFNWASENHSVPIDNIQTLKKMITGEAIILEKKRCTPVESKLNIINIFHLNDMPVIKTNQEAIKSRFAIIEFNNVFSSNPDPSKSYEKKSNQKFKHDLNFLFNELLPGLVNRLIKEFKLLLKEGIDFSFQDTLMNQIKQESNHLHEFIEDKNLVECQPSLGFTSKDLYNNLYLKWCTEQGFIKSGDGFIFEDPSSGDKIARNPAVLTKKLKSVFPRLKIEKFRGMRKVGLRVA